MPIVVNELVCKAAVKLPSNDKMPPGKKAQATVEQKILIEACVEEVMKILEQKQER